MELLSRINDPADLRAMQPSQLPQLARELREFIIDVVSTKEGHLGASLGVVELTVALHYCYNTPDDRLIWDVGHQAYGHKILTGRREQFHTNRKYQGISGFPKREESPYDAFGTGHSSTSLSAILGMAMAARLEGKDRKHIAVIGDASIASGMAFEALNHMGVTDTDVLVVLNDNAIGIDPSVGALKRYLTNVKKGTAKDENLFECLNFHYSGPVDGHDLPALIRAFTALKTVKGPKLLHLITTKGKGLKKAEEEQVLYHAPGKFDKHTGELIRGEQGNLPAKYQDVFGHTLVELAEKDPRIVGITPAMPTGSSMKYMIEAFPDRAWDVGIAEQHAVTMAAGMAAEGLVPFCNIYSTFLQRAYDQVIHDVALQQLPVIFCLDRAGIVGEDGATHHGVFDLAYLRCIPNLMVAAPMDEVELRHMMYTFSQELDRPVAIRYPRGRGVLEQWKKPMEPIPIGKGSRLRKGSRIAILTLGPCGNTVRDILEGTDPEGLFSHYNMRFLKPLDETLIAQILSDYELIITLEDGVKAGGFGSAVSEFAAGSESRPPIQILGVPDRFLDHGSPELLREEAGIDQKTLTHYINQLIHERT